MNLITVILEMRTITPLNLSGNEFYFTDIMDPRQKLSSIREKIKLCFGKVEYLNGTS